MLLQWQRGELEDVALSASDDNEEDCNSNGGETEEEYMSYVSNMSLHSHIACADYSRCMEKIEMHYAALGVELLFKKHPYLEAYLSETPEGEGKLISQVRCSL